MTDVLRREHRTARKRHYCHDCWRFVTPGERYEAMTGVTDGEIKTWKRCQQCQLLADHLWRTARDAWDDDYGLDFLDFLWETRSPLSDLMRNRWIGVTPEELAARIAELERAS